MEYDQRRCPICTNCVEDERHAIFDCNTYTFQRQIFAELFTNANDLRSFLVSNAPHRVAQFLNACRLISQLGLPDVDLDSILSLDIDDYESDFQSDGSCWVPNRL